MPGSPRLAARGAVPLTLLPLLLVVPLLLLCSRAGWRDLAALGLAAILWRWTLSLGCRRVERWASEQGHRVLDLELRHWRRGPYQWHNGNQLIYRARILTPQGTVRSCWLRCGSPLLGVLDDRVEATLDEPEPHA